MRKVIITLFAIWGMIEFLYWDKHMEGLFFILVAILITLMQISDDIRSAKED